ncbi:major facilitator superfamily domain-containing protein [Gaertneriomyces semiglobifer]|nr:major facilitator superfamily domain-containing protein [Gaertneriomyces semiglobifer]
MVLSQILHVPSSEIGNVSGSLAFYDQLVSLVAVLCWGLVSDRLGRSFVYGAGFAIMSLGLALFTFAHNVYPQLLMCRLLFAIGGAASTSMMTAVLADYAGDEDRGKTSGLVGLLSGSGALLALFGFMRLPSRLGGFGLAGVRNTYMLASCVCALYSVVLWTCLKTKSRTPENEEEEGLLPHRRGSHEAPLSPALDSLSTPDDVAEKKLTEIALEGLLAARDLRVLLGYAGSFLARGDTIILTLFLPLWIYRYYIDKGFCPDGTDPGDPDMKDHCREAYLRSSILSGIAQTCALVGAPFFGYLSDKFHRPLPMLFIGMIGAISYFGPYSNYDPGMSAVIWMILIGLAEIGMIVGSLSLVTGSYIPATIRGSVAGVSSFCGAAGILINTKVGGYLFDHWTAGAPFFLMAVMHVVYCCIAMAVIVSINPRQS